MVPLHIREHKKTLCILIALIGVLAFVTYSFVSPRGMFSGLKNDLKSIAPAEGVSYTDLDGNRVDLTDFKGKPLVVNSWATWMPFSQTELPLLARIKSEKGDAVTILAINRMEQAPVIISYLSAFGIDRRALPFLVDPGDTFYKAVGGYAMPETVFYNADGVITHHVRGTLTEDELRTTVDALLSE